ncbi:D-tyrosyl-tRNA(Tyr) deacylase [Candidatus Woesebacteria bacterium RBG_13_36_22]|uniref:D-aminoacyl-tRNA deacylase n=1 Tax=Candidatus Woesebacteria bacterium RBG_13_36_22 TaxID=1802478 RepID=A0A1F7X100_9BACT|nr:MAG: D-tyrosyl-tRNA(Tyr) deacylase [Candidatus Woesebacteria bacterium RBG_13_36_22]
MKLVVQRVKEAQVRLIPSNEVIGKIGKGIFILVGVGRGDDINQIKSLAEKISKLRIISDKNGKMNLSVKETDSEVLVVSQFTLYADITGGNRPSFIGAALSDEAEKIYDEFVNCLKSLGLKVKTGKFGEYMEIYTILDGPVTILY